MNVTIWSHNSWTQNILPAATSCLHCEVSWGQVSDAMVTQIQSEPSHLVKEQAQLAFWFADPLAEAVGSFPHEEGNLPVALATLVGKRPCYQGLSCPRRAVEQTPSGKGRQRKRRIMETNTNSHTQKYSEINTECHVFSPGRLNLKLLKDIPLTESVTFTTTKISYTLRIKC